MSQSPGGKVRRKEGGKRGRGRRRRGRKDGKNQKRRR
jgi:hypothetical protein